MGDTTGKEGEEPGMGKIAREEERGEGLSLSKLQKSEREPPRASAMRRP